MTSPALRPFHPGMDGTSFRLRRASGGWKWPSTTKLLTREHTTWTSGQRSERIVVMVYELCLPLIQILHIP